jgi:translocation and assembly module TamB
MENEKKSPNYPRKIARIVLKTVLFLFLFIVLIFLLVLTPPVQRFMTGKVENYLREKLKTKVEIGSISFGLSGKVNLENVYIEDLAKDTLVSGGVIKAQMNFLRLFSNEVQIKDLELQHITAKIKRTLPDTAFNFQFIVDAFTSEKVKNPDTAATAPLKLNISDISLEDIRLTYLDVVSGSDLYARIGNLSATIDTLDPYSQHFDIPTIIARNVQATVKQVKPLMDPEPLSKDLADAATPSAMRLSLGLIDLSRIAVNYANDVSAFYTNIKIGKLKSEPRVIDLQQNKIFLDQLILNQSRVAIRLGKKEAARIVEKEVEQEIVAQKKAGWDFRIDKVLFDNNSIQFDNDNNPTLTYGMDYSHLQGDSLDLHVENFVMNTDSIGGRITKGNFFEKSGFQLDALEGDVLYANNQSYLRDLYIKTPGSEIRRNAELKYASYDALLENFERTEMDIEFVDSRVQVKDILTFAPQLRKNAALSNPEDTWYINLVGRGNLDRLFVEDFQFDGLRNTRINAEGTLTGLLDPNKAGGNFTIHRLHTTQSDLALFTGQRLSTPEINLPEEFDINGTVSGNAGRLQTNLNVNTSSGFMAVNGWFSNLTNPAATRYDAAIRANGIQLGRILRQPATYGSVTGRFTFRGKGLTPASMDTRFTGQVSSLGYNRYQYRNIRLNGSLQQTRFEVNADVNDPNADMDIIASGNFSGNPSFRIDGMIDSLKTLPLHFTTEPFIFRGKVNGSVSNISADNMDADLLITKALFVAGNERLPLDTVHLVSGRTDTGNFLRLRSDIATAYLEGQYRLADLGSILQNSIQPYFSVAAKPSAIRVQPYDFTVTADMVYSPILAAFLPGLTAMEPLHLEGSFVTNGGMQAKINTPYIVYNGNEISNADLGAETTAEGLKISGNLARIKSGQSFDVYNTRITAIANNNTVNFDLGIDDNKAKNKYFFRGILTQPSTGTYSISLKPDSLLLNYERWTVSADNRITISTDDITANNFVLQKDAQRLTINSLPGSGKNPLQVSFDQFRLATITGFIKSDSLLVDGLMNGNITFSNLLQQPVFTSDLTINDLSMKQDTIGNVNLQVSSGANNRYLTNATITGRGNDVSLKGSFAPVGASDIDLDLDLDIRQLQLNTMEGALANLINNASGYVDGKVQVKGTTSDPDIRGNLGFNKASFAMNLLGSQFRIDNEDLVVTENGFIFENFVIRDTANNAMTINGVVFTSNFINYNFGLNVDATNFELLNTEKKPNQLYYGKLNVTTELRVSGTEVNPVVDGTVTVNEGTNLSVVVPQPEPGVVEREGIVQFVDMDAPENDSLFLAADSLNRINILGLDVAANIEIKKEAIFNVILDEANGDFLNVRGEALLTTGIDPSGKTTLVGNYSLEEGSYQISFNFLQRKFDIEKGSTITWTGEPTTARLNVTAVYIANTAPLDLVADQISAPTAAIRNTYLQKLPFEVRLSLTGELLKPVIDFDLVLPQDQNYGVSNDIVTAVQTRLEQMRQDEGEINKQVFSLLLLGRFVGENPFKSSSDAFSASTYARQSVSKLMTEQLNNLAAGLFEGVGLNFDVVSAEDYTTGERRNRTDLNVGLSKRLLNDRLQVSVGSNFQLEGPQNSNQRSNNIAGNIALNYQLSRDGRYMLRFYRQNEYEGVVDGYIIETGLGFILSVDYNKFKEILHRRKQRVTTEGTTQNPTGQ